MRVYLIPETGELAIVTQVSPEQSRRYISGTMIRERYNDRLTIYHRENLNPTAVNLTAFSAIEDETGTPYASFDALWTAIDPFFRASDVGASPLATQVFRGEAQTTNNDWTEIYRFGVEDGEQGFYDFEIFAKRTNGNNLWGRRRVGFYQRFDPVIEENADTYVTPRLPSSTFYSSREIIDGNDVVIQVRGSNGHDVDWILNGSKGLL